MPEISLYLVTGTELAVQPVQAGFASCGGKVVSMYREGDLLVLVEEIAWGGVAHGEADLDEVLRERVRPVDRCITSAI